MYIIGGEAVDSFKLNEDLKRSVEFLIQSKQKELLL